MGKKGSGNSGVAKKEQPAKPESVVVLLKPSLDGISQCIFKLNTASTSAATGGVQSARGKRSRDVDTKDGAAIGSSEEVDELYSVLTDHLTSLGELLEVYQKALLPCASIIVSHLLPILGRHRAPVEAWRCAASCATLFGSAAVPLLKSIGEHLVADLQNPNKLLGRSSGSAVGPALAAASEAVGGPVEAGEEQQQVPPHCAIVLHPVFVDLEKFQCLIEMMYGVMEFACTSSIGGGGMDGVGAEGGQSFSSMIAGITVRLLASWRLCPLSFSLATTSGATSGSSFERNDAIAEMMAEFCVAVVTVARPLLPEVLAEAHLLIASTRPYSVKTRAAIARLKATIGSVQHPTVIPIAVSSVAPTLPAFVTVASSSQQIAPTAEGPEEVAEATTSASAPVATASRFGSSSKSAAANLLSSFLAPPPVAEPVVAKADPSGGASAAAVKAAPPTTADDEIPMIVDSDDE